MDTSLKRYELEDYVEAQLLDIAESLIPISPGKEELKAATASFPEFFGGKFPHLGLRVARTDGESRLADKPQWPGRLIVQVRIYYPCLPKRASQKEGLKASEDQTALAGQVTRHVRGQFLEKLILSSFGRHHVGIPDSRGDWIDELGGLKSEERGQWYLWTDLTELPITL